MVPKGHFTTTNDQTQCESSERLQHMYKQKAGPKQAQNDAAQIVLAMTWQVIEKAMLWWSLINRLDTTTETPKTGVLLQSTGSNHIRTRPELP